LPTTYEGGDQEDSPDADAYREYKRKPFLEKEKISGTICRKKNTHKKGRYVAMRGRASLFRGQSRRLKATLGPRRTLSGELLSRASGTASGTRRVGHTLKEGCGRVSKSGDEDL